jgi:hypothetical protein
VAKKPKPKTQHVWRIVEIRKRSHYVGIIDEAATAEEAVVKAIEKFEITNPERQKRLMALREG